MRIIRIVPTVAAISFSLYFMLPGTAAAEIEIDHKELDKVNSGVRAELDAEVKEKGTKAGIREARAYFKTLPANRFYFIPLISSNSEDYSGVLPAMAAGTKSFDYFILARSNDDQIVKTETFSVQVEDSKQALSRMESKPPRDVKIDIDKIQQASDLVEDSRKATDTDRANVARRGGEPDPNRRVDVRTETPEAPTDLAGVDDYVNLQVVGPSEVIGASAVQSAAIAGGGGTGTGGAALGGLAVAGALAAGAAAAGGGSDGGSSTNTGDQTGGTGTARFAGTLNGSWSGFCDGSLISGLFVMNIASDGSINGAYTGDDQGSLSGSVADTGLVDVTASGGLSSIGCSWSGSFSDIGGLSGNGSWTCDAGCNGSWSG